MKSARVLLRQFLRFGAVGIVITLLSAISYWLLAQYAGLHPNIALLLVFAVFSVIGYFLHGRFSFEVAAGAPRRAIAQYLVVNGAGLGLNQLWVTLLVEHWGAPLWSPVVPMVLITPAMTFLLLRSWVYRSAGHGALSREVRR